MKLDLSKLKHIKSDDKTTTLQHKDGHQITLAHSALSKSNQEQLKALSGISKDAQTPVEQGAARQAKQVAANPQSRTNNGFGAINSSNKPMPGDGKVIMKAEGGEVSTPKEKSPEGGAAPGCITTGSSKYGTVTVCDAEGGEIEKPSANAPSDAAPGCSVVSTSKKYGNVIMCDAKGGRVVMSHPEGAKFCANCGGPANAKGVNEYAKGGDVEKDDDSFLSHLKSSTSQVLGLDDSGADTKGSNPKQEAARRVYNESMMQHPVETRFSTQGEAPDTFNADKYSAADATANKAASVQNMHQTESAEDTVAENKVRSQAGVAPLPVPGAQEAAPDVSGASQEVSAGQPTPDASTPSPPPSDAAPAQGAPHDAQGLFDQGLNQGIAGTNAAAKAQGDLGTAQAEEYKNTIAAQQQMSKDYDTQFQALDNERKAHMADIENGHIDPNQYWTGDAHGNGGHSRIMAGIGMILAGFNPTTNPNAAIDYINKQMDMNIKAQERNLGANENLLSANLKQFGNLKDARDMTRLMLNDTLGHQLAQAAAAAQTPQAKAAAQMAQSKLMMDAVPEAQNLSMRRMLTGMAGDSGADPEAHDRKVAALSLINPAAGKTMAESSVSGYGSTSDLSPVPQTVRDSLSDHRTVQALGADLLHYAKSNTNLVVGSPEYNRGVTKADAFQQAARKTVLSKTYRPGSQPMLEEIAQSGNPAGLMKNLKTIPKLESFLVSDRIESDSLANSNKLPIPKRGQAQEPQYKVVNGVKYMRGPNGDAIPVK